ncbi:MAG: hypothetical protein JWL59_3407 [Chthoniobacteraceae bacterium]|nr:hypothetical protein [Chthoniobacteraceae bacterium]
MGPDVTKSLAQLTGVDWGMAPEKASSLVRDRHEFRQTPMGSLSIPALTRLLALDFQGDCDYLIPHSLDRLALFPLEDAKAISQHCILLLGVLRNEHYNWMQMPELVRQARRLVEKACYTLYCDSDEAEQTSDSLEYYKVLLPNTQMESSLYEALVRFEQRLSKVESGTAPD